MEALFAILIVCLAALGLAVGLLFGRNPPQAGCAGLSCVGGTRCQDCPHREKEPR